MFWWTFNDDLTVNALSHTSHLYAATETVNTCQNRCQKLTFITAVRQQVTVNVLFAEKGFATAGLRTRNGLRPLVHILDVGGEA